LSKTSSQCNFNEFQIRGGAVAEGPLLKPNHLAHEQDVIIGGRLREMRRQRNLRLKQVAKEADLSVSMLSQIERGISSPSIRVLRGICHALGVDGAALFATQDAAVIPDSVPSNPLPHVGEDFVIRVADRKPLSVGGVTKYRVTPAGCSVMEGFLMEIGADASLDVNFVLQTGDKIGYVVRGNCACSSTKSTCCLKPETCTAFRRAIGTGGKTAGTSLRQFWSSTAITSTFSFSARAANSAPYLTGLYLPRLKRSVLMTQDA
jgi:transcriptional regulator with XRE-family HTH domain